ncbi:MAG: molybdopterin molybdenumtransferase MoeA, partial [Pseudomonadota bacterium]|nr:molybdopterin molybdenumtransferase MoeA [Pseudomonadota bacterium]
MENQGSGVNNRSFLSVKDALQRIIKDISTVSTEEVSLTSALDRVTAEDVKARRSQPPVAVSSMDGYAVKSEDVTTVPSKLIRVASVPAGREYTKKLKNGEAVRIFTGAPVPKGADTIVIQEDVIASSETDGSEITIVKGAKKGVY